MTNINFRSLQNNAVSTEKIDKKIEKDSKEEAKSAGGGGKNGKKLNLALKGLAVLGISTAIGITAFKYRDKIFQKIGGKVKEEAEAEIQEVVQKSQKKLPDIKKLSEIDFKNLPKKSFIIEDILPNSDRIRMEYVDGVLKKSERSGSVNFEKVYTTLENGRHQITKTHYGQTTSVILEDITEATKKSQDELKELIAKKTDFSPTEFKNQAESIKYKSKAQQKEIAQILSEKVKAETQRRADFINKVIYNYNNENDEYIKRIISCSDEQFQIIETLLKSKTRGIGNYYARNPKELFQYNSCYETLDTIKDKARLKKILTIVSKDKGVELYEAIELSKYDDKMFERASALTDRGLNYFARKHKDKIEALDNVQFKRILDLSDIGNVFCLNDNELLKCTDLDDKAFKRAVLLCDKYCVDSRLTEIAQLPDSEFESVLAKIKAGVPSYLARKMSEEEFNNFLFLVNAGVNKDGILSYAELSSRQKCEEFLGHLRNNLKKGIDVEDLENPEIKAKIVERINAQYGYEVLKPDCTIKDIAWKWRQKYIEGGMLEGDYSESCIDAFLETLGRYQLGEEGQQLGRWIYRDDLYKFIQDFPEVGETYAPKRIQSFAKTLFGAEIYRGNNFSDTNTSKNIKMVVTPKAVLTKAFDIGEGKYGSDEVIYGATQQFKVLKKGFEMVVNPDGKKHRQYVIYMQEL